MVFLGLLARREELLGFLVFFFGKYEIRWNFLTKRISRCVVRRRVSRVSGLNVFVSLVMCVWETEVPG